MGLGGSGSSCFCVLCCVLVCVRCSVRVNFLGLCPVDFFVTVRLTSIYYRVPWNWESLVTLSETIAGHVKKIRSPTWGIIWGRWPPEICLVVEYILLKSHSSLCRLLSDLNFELLRSVTYVYLCALVRTIESLQKMNETRDMCSFCCMPPPSAMRTQGQRTWRSNAQR